MSEHWTDRLSEYIDGELNAQDRAALEQHLETCTECAGTLRELREVVARASALTDRPPQKSLWPAIAEEIDVADAPAGRVLPLRRRREQHVRRFAFSLPQLVAAGIVLAVLSAGTAWWLRPDGGAPPPTLATDTVTRGSSSVRWVNTETAQRYAAAVSDLERVLAERRHQLDPKTVQVLDENLRIIDRAIQRSLEALEADPNNPYLNEHMAETMQRKIELLRRATTIATAAS